jgi:hypothetical protein
LIRTASVEEQMLTRMMLIASATLAIFAATICLSVETSRAGTDCLAKPNATPPQGAHWYYRVDRPTQRQCWYLAAEGGRVVQRRERQTDSSVRRIPKTVAQVEEQAAAETTTAAPAAASAAANAPVVDNDEPATLSTRWSGFSRSPVALDGALPAMSSYAQERATAVPEDDMPLIWPILTSAELAQAEPVPQSATSFWPLAAAFAAVLALAALIAHTFLRLTAARKSTRVGVHETPGSKSRPPAVRPRPMRPRSDRVPETEASVRRLLQELQRRDTHYRMA